MFLPMKIRLVLIGTLILSACVTVKDAPNIGALNVSFEWTPANRCSPTSPAFVISNIPAGTEFLDFRMVDLNVPAYQHGGGKVKNDGSGKINAGAFSYVGPCPPAGGRHNYQFTVTALNSAGDTALARGTTSRAFPPQ